MIGKHWSFESSYKSKASLSAAEIDSSDLILVVFGRIPVLEGFLKTQNAADPEVRGTVMANVEIMMLR